MKLPAFLIAAILAASAFAQNDDAYGKKIKDYTTDSFFLTELVDHLPTSTKVTSPMKHFGDIVGAPNVLHHVNEINAYMRLLAKESPRVQVQSMGKSEDGREMITVIISNKKKKLVKDCVLLNYKWETRKVDKELRKQVINLFISNTDGNFTLENLEDENIVELKPLLSLMIHHLKDRSKDEKDIMTEK